MNAEMQRGNGHPQTATHAGASAHRCLPEPADTGQCERLPLALVEELVQVYGNSTRVVEYAANKLTNGGKHKNSTKLEAKTVLWTVTDRFHSYLRRPEHFKIFTDNLTVDHTMSRKNHNLRRKRYFWNWHCTS